MARDVKRKPVPPTHQDAVAYDLSGALFRIGYETGSMDASNELRDVLTRVAGGREADRLWLLEWQDQQARRHEDVLALIDAALSTLSAESPSDATGSGSQYDDV